VDGTLASVEPEVLIGRVVEIIRSFRPDVVITFVLDGGYGHPDHMTIIPQLPLPASGVLSATSFPRSLPQDCQ
jgi:GlcNAc-PI de-N-acetylase